MRLNCLVSAIEVDKCHFTAESRSLQSWDEGMPPTPPWRYERTFGKHTFVPAAKRRGGSLLFGSLLGRQRVAHRSVERALHAQIVFLDDLLHRPLGDDVVGRNRAAGSGIAVSVFGFLRLSLWFFFHASIVARFALLVCG